MMSSPTASSTPTDSQSRNGSMVAAPKPGLRNIDAGGTSFRAAYREGNESGKRQGAAAYLNSPVTEQIALELTVLRVAMTAMSSATEQRERLLELWKAEAAFWKAEHDRVHDEYCGFVEEMRRKYVR